MTNPTDTNQAGEDELINQHLVCLWQLKDIEETISDASPEELVDLHSKLVALSTDITEAIQSLIRTEKLKLLAEVRERVMSEGDFVDAEILKKLYDKAYSNGYNDRGYENSYNSQDYRSAEDIAPVIAKIRGGYEKRLANLTKLEAEL